MTEMEIVHYESVVTNNEGQETFFHQPILLDFLNTMSKIVLVLMSVYMFYVSMYSGAGIYAALLRSSLTALFLGLYAWALNWFCTISFLNAVRKKYESENGIKFQKIEKVIETRGSEISDDSEKMINEE